MRSLKSTIGSPRSRDACAAAGSALALANPSAPSITTKTMGMTTHVFRDERGSEVSARLARLMQKGTRSVLGIASRLDARPETARQDAPCTRTAQLQHGQAVCLCAHGAASWPRQNSHEGGAPWPLEKASIVRKSKHYT
jgi:hypothetical protein